MNIPPPYPSRPVLQLEWVGQGKSVTDDKTTYIPTPFADLLRSHMDEWCDPPRRWW